MTAAFRDAWLPQRALLAAALALLSCQPAAEVPAAATIASAVRTPPASPTRTPTPIEDWLAASEFVKHYPLVPSGRIAYGGERLNLEGDALQRVIQTEMPFMYDAAVKLARQRDSQSKFVGWFIRDHVQRFDFLGKTRAISLLDAALSFYSPLDNNLVTYTEVFDESGVRQKLQLDPSASGIDDGFDLYRDRVQDQHGPLPPDYRESPNLRDPWANGFLQSGILKTWQLSGRPSYYDLLVGVSSRVPYDCEIWLFPDKDIPNTRPVFVLVHLADYYVSQR